MIDPRCKCTMGISLTGDGCRYCQTQEYIDRLHDMIDEEREEAEVEVQALKVKLLLVMQNWQQGCPPLKQLDDDIQQLEQEIQESGS